jgi:chromosome condensin MukBEF complex kleisin-like MukF subunit
VKDKNLDKDAIMKYVEDNIEQNDWKTLIKSSFEVCLKEVVEKLPEIQKKLEAAPFNLKKDECDVQFIAVAFCASMETIKVCLSSNSTEESKMI